MSKQGISIIEHFSNILSYLQKVSEELKNNSNTQELIEKYKLDYLRIGIESDISRIQDILNETLKKKEEDENNEDINREVREVLIAIHEAALDIHQHFIDIAEKFIQYIQTFDDNILDQIKERINSGVFKLEELKQINTKLTEILNYRKYEI
ncbi:MAG: hypothetical protein RMJ51_01960 [Candidatus Calescibacterium sp.]|nr:hypothetical protein [Candidatus Calescibacterium sp.]MCX7971907.1 hypothetical protein [bacterium]MDW8194994.1 hypothetical protein [Candidatus Calescibacterium sp.]